MKTDNFRISKAFLESGNDLKLTSSLSVRHPTINDILNLGNGINCDGLYWNYVSALVCDPYDNMVWLDDSGIDYQTVSAFDVFVMRFIACKKSREFDGQLSTIKTAVTFFFGNHDFDLEASRNGELVLVDKNDCSVCINSEMFHYMGTFIQLINRFNNSNKIIPADKTAKRILIEDMRAEQKKKAKARKQGNSDYLGNLISSVIHGGNGGVTPFNVKQLKIYSLLSGFSVQQKKNHYDHVMSGVYHGTVNPDSINKHELSWVE